jgi:hypothetical protein
VFVAFGTQREMSLHYISPSMTFPALLYFSALSHKRHDFREKKVTEYNMCVFIFSAILLEMLLILGIIKRDLITNVCWSSCKVLLILVGFKLNLKFSRQIFENTQISNLMKICSVGAELFHGTGRHDEASSQFSRFCERA